MTPSPAFLPTRRRSPPTMLGVSWNAKPYRIFILLICLGCVAFNFLLGSGLLENYKLPFFLDQPTGLWNSSEPIDVVFTYVNGSDPAHIALLQECGKEVSAERFRDFGQLKYAMRSVYMHAPWVRDFIVVVSNKTSQVPNWLDAQHPRIRVVEHEEIWDNAENLPSMNSNAIEWSLMNIPGLSDKFLYLNDDLVLAQKLDRVTVMPSHDRFVLWEAWIAPRNPHTVDDDYGKALAFVYQKFDRKYGQVLHRKVASHVPQLLDRDVLSSIKADFADEFAQMYKSKPFRNPHDIQFQFAYQQYILQHRKYFVAPPNHHHFVNVQADYKHNDEVMRELETDPRQYWCIQDGFREESPTAEIQYQIEGFYEKHFPAVGPWEIQPEQQQQ